MADKDNDSSKRPKGKRFPPGLSGNLKGRPKGSRNAPDLLDAILKEKVGPKGSRGRKSTVRTIIEVQYAKAHGGNKSAQAFIHAFLDKLGLGDNVTTEERERRSIRLPRPLTFDEWELQDAEPRERERQLYRAILDREDPTGRSVSQGIVAGDAHLDKGAYDAALTCYADELSRSKLELKNKPDDAAIKRNVERATARIGLLADHLLQIGDFDRAATCTETALGQDDVSGLTWIALIGAHAQMFLFDTEKTRPFYLGFKSNKRVTFVSWESMILRDFAGFRKIGRSSPLMDEVEAKLLQAGWRTTHERVDTEVAQNAMTDAEKELVMLNPRDLETAVVYTKYKKLDEAAEVYRYLLKKHYFALDQHPQQSGARETIEMLRVRFGLLAKDFVFAGRFGTAVECLDELPLDRLWLQAIRAHALMLAGNTGEAEDIYLKYRGQRINDQVWETVILDDFRSLKRKGHFSRLMDTLEAQFKSSGLVPAQVPEPADPRPEPRPAPVPVAKAPDLAEGEDILSAQQLFKDGRLEDSLKVYRKRMKVMESRFANNIATAKEREDRQAVVDGMSDIAFQFLLKNEPQKALDLVDEALLIWNSNWAALRRAHALMLLYRRDEALPIYSMHMTGQATLERTKADVIRDEFAAMRAANLSRPLMEEIESQLVAPQSGRILTR